MFENFQLKHKYLINSKSEDSMFIMISLLHLNGFISDKSLFAQFKNLRKGKMVRQINSYHSNVNDEWYNYDHITEVYDDILSSMLNPKSGKAKLKFDRINKLRMLNGLEPKVHRDYLTFEETLLYLNKYLNKNRNYCIDYFFSTIIKPHISTYGQSTLSNIFNYDFSKFERDFLYRSNDEYCCEYCCGEYSDWVERRHSYIDSEIEKHFKEKTLEVFNKFLNEKRTKYKGSYKKFTLY